ncbi:MAG: right-handed parallel beta-helix repeat-containing protein [Pseudomonadota bacterium]
MASGIGISVRAAILALTAAIVPQTALGELSAVDLFKMRDALKQAELDLLAGPPEAGKAASVLTLVKPRFEPVLVPSGNPTTVDLLVGGQSLFGAIPDQSTTAPKTAAALGLFADTAPQAAPQEVGTTDFRILLASLAQAHTGKNNQAVINAQGLRGPVAVSVRSGTVGLDDLRGISASLGFAPRPDGTLTAPVVIWPDATLELAPGERLALARDKGAFLMSMGTLRVSGATIEAVGPKNAVTPSFTPFVTVLQGGAIEMQGATLRGLGFGQTPKFLGLSVVGALMTREEGQVQISNTVIDGLKGVFLASAPGAVLEGNTFFNMRDASLQLTDAPRTRIAGNLFVGEAPTNAIRVDMGSGHTVLEANVFLGGERVAILVDRGSDHVEVRGNLVWGRDGAGVKFLRTRCGIIEDNLILDNRQKGIEVRRSTDTVVGNNVIAGNRSAGIWVSAQNAAAQTALKGNVLRGNGAGLATATGAEIWLSGNNLAGQMPKLVDGDISSLTRHFVIDLRGETPLRIRDGQAHEKTHAPFCRGTF